MESELLSMILQAGPLGAVIAAMALFIAKSQKQLKEVQEARVADAQKVIGTMLALNDRWSETISELTNAVNELKIVLQTISTKR